MNPQAAIAALDRAVAAAGSDFTLTRESGLESNVALSIQIRAAKRGRISTELTDAVRQEDSTVVLSPSEMLRHQWSWPARAGDKLADKAGHVYSVEHVDPIEISGTIVRYDMRVRG